jgi:hypothetical protein
VILDSPTTERLALTHGAARCDLLPQVGGSIGSWAMSGQPMLRTASEPGIAARDPGGRGPSMHANTSSSPMIC